jgi:MFS transporter, DHA3 family, multidrug efflux protein
VLLAVGMFVHLCVMPYIEASEQTVLQKVVPFERQGRVFGFAKFVVIPFMTTASGAELIGPWFGVGAERGIALVFTGTGLIGLTLTLFMLGSRAYRQLSDHYLDDALSVLVAVPAT